MRAGARWFKTRQFPMHMEDICMYGALVSFAIMCALYLATIPTFFNITAIEAGLMEPYASLESDLVVMLKEFFVVQFFYWLTLWAVKWSLLFMFKRVTEGLPLYTKLWWAMLVFSALTFIGCCISNFTSCSSMHAWFTAGLCETPRDSRAKTISLWYCLGVDLLTDLLSAPLPSPLVSTQLTWNVIVMAIPIRVLWNLRISLVEKISIGVVFVVGIITMVTAIVRSVSLESTSGTGQVSTTWLMLVRAPPIASRGLGHYMIYAPFMSITRGRLVVVRTSYIPYDSQCLHCITKFNHMLTLLFSSGPLLKELLVCSSIFPSFQMQYIC